MGRDQDDTAARVVHHGAGVRLPRSASAAAVRDAATRVLERDEYRRAAQRLAAAIDAERDPTGLVSALESPTGNRRPLGH